MADRRGDQGLQEIVRCHREGEQEGNVGSSIERGSVFRLYVAEKGRRTREQEHVIDIERCKNKVRNA